MRTLFKAILALLMSLSCVSTGEAIVLIYEEGPKIGQRYFGPIEVKFEFFGEDTLYTPQPIGTQVGVTNNPPAGAPLLDAITALQATNPHPIAPFWNNLEDCWGILRVTEILTTELPARRVWSPAARAFEITGIFYGGQGFFLEQNAGGPLGPSITYNSVNVQLDLYERPRGVATFDHEHGPSARTSPTMYPTATLPQACILTLKSTAGFLRGAGSLGGPATEWESNFNGDALNGSGSCKAFFSAAMTLGGAGFQNFALDSNEFQAQHIFGNTADADVEIQSTETLGSGAWLVRGSGRIITTLKDVGSGEKPSPVAKPAGAINRTSAILNGEVNPNGYYTAVKFEFSEDGGVTWQSRDATPFSIVGFGALPVSLELNGLTSGRTYRFRVVAANHTTPSELSAEQTFETWGDPIATIDSAIGTNGGVQVTGTVRAGNAETTVFFDYSEDQGFQQMRSIRWPMPVTGNTPTPVTALITEILRQDVTYHCRIRAVHSDGVRGLSESLPITPALLSDTTHGLPVAVPVERRRGTLVVRLLPAGIPGAWRFAGEQQWRPSDVLVAGIADGDRVVEFRPVPGYRQPLTEIVSVSAGVSTPVSPVVREYYLAGASGGTGDLVVDIEPEGLPGARWRFLGEGDDKWLASGETRTQLNPGSYLIECEPLLGRTAPLVAAFIEAGVVNRAKATYYAAADPLGRGPVIVPFDEVNGSPTLPYQYVGQLRSDVNSGSGFVVRNRVVATAGHLVFDDGEMSAVTGLQWLFQRDKGVYEPTPQIPRGFFLMSGYAAQRKEEATPGESRPESQDLDAAALYFTALLAPNGAELDAGLPGRASFSGYLASDRSPNEWLTSSALKTLVGYPTVGLPLSSQGRMHATPPANVAFSLSYRRVYVNDTSDLQRRITSSAGASGGPLCVQFGDNRYYPAAIFISGAGQTVVRAIDSSLLALFTLAENAGNTGTQSGDGGTTRTSTLATGENPTQPALRVTLRPGLAAQASGGGWRFATSPTTHASGEVIEPSVGAGDYVVYYNDVPDFITPGTPQSLPVSGRGTQVRLSPGRETRITATYHGIVGHPVSLTRAIGSSASFSVNIGYIPVPPEEAAPAYRWQRRATGSEAAFQDIPAAASPTYSIAAVDTGDAGEYRVVVTWPNGIRMSKAAILTVSDVIRDPTLKVGGPLAKAIITGTDATLRGSVRGDAAIDRVEIVLNNGAPQIAIPTGSSWAFTATPEIGLEQGSNTVRVRAFDAEGNASKELTRTFSFRHLRPHLAGQYNGLIVATTDSVNLLGGNGLFGISVTTTGAFTGKVTLGGAKLPVSGLFLNDGSARFGKARSATYELAGDKPRRSLGHLALTLDTGSEGKVFGTLTNEVSGATRVLAHIVGADLAVHTKARNPDPPRRNVPAALRDPAWENGRYTAVFLPGAAPNHGLAAHAFPQGSGFARLAITSSGRVAMVGRLPDGSAISYANALSKDHLWPVFIPLYGNKGFLTGEVTFDPSQSQSDAAGSDLFWLKPAALPKQTIYPDGWPDGITIDFAASKYLVPVAPTAKNPTPPNAQTVLGPGLDPAASTTIANIVVTLGDGGFLSATSNDASLNPRIVRAKTSITVLGPTTGQTGTDSLKATFYPLSGLLKGSFTHPGNGKAVLFQGVAHQKTNTASGFFLFVPATAASPGTPPEIGKVSIRPK